MYTAEKQLSQNSLWESFMKFLGQNLYVNDDASIRVTIGTLLLILLILFITSIALSIVKRVLSKKLPEESKAKFITVFSFSKWLIYVLVILMVLSGVGINLTAVLAASAGLLLGIGLALQTLFQDIISGVFILIDQSVHVGDIIEMDGKVGRVEQINLRTTRAVTIDNKVIIIPNHLYLTNSLYNWTQNGSTTRENIMIGVAYGSDVELVKKLLLQVANDHDSILNHPEPMVLFTNFGDSALDFKLVFTLNDSFIGSIPKSDLRFEIDRLFREHHISIPFPQRDIHIVSQP